MVLDRATGEHRNRRENGNGRVVVKRSMFAVYSQAKDCSTLGKAGRRASPTMRTSSVRELNFSRDALCKVVAQRLTIVSHMGMDMQLYRSSATTKFPAFVVVRSRVAALRNPLYQTRHNHIPRATDNLNPYRTCLRNGASSARASPQLFEDEKCTWGEYGTPSSCDSCSRSRKHHWFATKRYTASNRA